MPQTAVGFVALVVAGCAFASRYLSITNHATFITAALSPYLMLCAPLSAALLIWGRHWILAIAAVGLTVAAFAVQLPLYLDSDARRTAGVEVRLMSANIYEGMADPDHLVRSAQAQADVIEFQELTPQEADRLSGAGLDATFPYRWLDARSGSGGVCLWSRFPIDAPRRIGGYTFAFLTAPMTAAALSVRLAFESRRSMRAAIVACSVAGTLTALTSAADRYAPGSPRSTPRSASSRTISSAKKGLPAARSAILSPSARFEGVRTEQPRDQCRGF
jgi:hypothetical protein